MNPFPLRIDGIAVATTDHFEVINPATGELAAEAPCATLADVDAAVAAAKRALPGWRSESNGTRQRACIAIADLLDRHREELARLLTQEQGKPLYPDYGSRWEVLKRFFTADALIEELGGEGRALFAGAWFVAVQCSLA